MEKTTTTIQLSIKQKEYTMQFAAENEDKSFNQVVREALAAYTGYDLQAEKDSCVERRGRPRKYLTPEAKREAARLRAQEKADLARRLLEDHKRQQRRRDAENMEKSLAAKGVLLN